MIYGQMDRLARLLLLHFFAYRDCEYGKDEEGARLNRARLEGMAQAANIFGVGRSNHIVQMLDEEYDRLVPDRKPPYMAMVQEKVLRDVLMERVADRLEAMRHA